MPQKKEPERYKSGRKKRRRSSYLLVYIFIGIVAAIVLTVLSLTVFFPIKTVTVEGKTQYKAEEIIDSARVPMGGNLFMADLSHVEDNITAELPYIASVEIKRSFPTKIVLKVTADKPYVQFEAGENYYLSDIDGKCLNIIAKPQKDVPIVRGCKLKDCKAGKSILQASGISDDFARITNIIDSGKQKNMAFTVVNVSDKQSMWATYNDKIVLLFGSENNIEEKLNYAEYVLEQRADNSETGTLNLSRIPNSKNQVSFIPSELTKEQKSK